MMIGAFTFWMVAVMPSLVLTFQSFDVELPVVTRAIIATYDFMKANALPIVIGIIAFIVIFIVLRKKIEQFRIATDRLTLKMPVVGITLSYYNYAFVAEYTRLMVAAGLPLFQALGILGDSMKNMVFKLGVSHTREAIGAGKTFSGAVAEQQLFSPLVIRMISVGEQTGSLESQLDYVSKYYYSKVDYISENIASLIQPILTVVLGFFLIIIMLGFLSPISDMVTGISNG
jgi:type II secretory pathway component PulF